MVTCKLASFLMITTLAIGCAAESPEEQSATNASTSGNGGAADESQRVVSVRVATEGASITGTSNLEVRGGSAFVQCGPVSAGPYELRSEGSLLVLDYGKGSPAAAVVLGCHEALSLRVDSVVVASYGSDLTISRTPSDVFDAEGRAVAVATMRGGNGGPDHVTVVFTGH